MAQFLGTASGYIITQPRERIKWRGLVEAGLIVLDEQDDYIIHLTVQGLIAFNLILGIYLPVEDMEEYVHGSQPTRV